MNNVMMADTVTDLIEVLVCGYSVVSGSFPSQKKTKGLIRFLAIQLPHLQFNDCVIVLVFIPTFP